MCIRDRATLWSPNAACECRHHPATRVFSDDESPGPTVSMSPEISVSSKTSTSSSWEGSCHLGSRPWRDDHDPLLVFFLDFDHLITPPFLTTFSLHLPNMYLMGTRQLCSRTLRQVSHRRTALHFLHHELCDLLLGQVLLLPHSV